MIIFQFEIVLLVETQVQGILFPNRQYVIEVIVQVGVGMSFLGGPKLIVWEGHLKSSFSDWFVVAKEGNLFRNFVGVEMLVNGVD